MATGKSRRIRLGNARPYNWLDAQDVKDASTKKKSKSEKKSVATKTEQ